MQSEWTSWKWGLGEDVRDIKEIVGSPMRCPRSHSFQTELWDQQPPFRRSGGHDILLWRNVFVWASGMAAAFPEE